jgi:tyrosine aminotransferase
LELVFKHLFKNGDNVLVPTPCSSKYFTASKESNVELRYFNLLSEDEISIDVDAIKSQIDKKTRAIVINNTIDLSG